MRKLLLIAILTIGMIANAQKNETIWQAWDKYILFCDQIVFDTLNETGIITFNYVEVETGLYALKPTDTIWDKKECREYKNVYSDFGTVLYWDNTALLSTYAMDTKVGEGWTEKTLTPEPAKKQQTIIRKKVCKIKSWKPDWDHFWDKWTIDNNYRK